MRFQSFRKIRVKSSFIKLFLINWIIMIFQLLCKGIYDIYNFAWIYMIFCKFIGVYMKLPLKFTSIIHNHV
ncbi:hypothetical protein Hanom_Chr01g00019381 [Helianthus anomalus]